MRYGLTIADADKMRWKLKGFNEVRLHRGRTSWRGGYESVCNRFAMTTGRWSFIYEKGWHPEHDKDDPNYIFKALQGKEVPDWAYKIKLCQKCFPVKGQTHTCECGHRHTVSQKKLDELAKTV